MREPNGASRILLISLIRRIVSVPRDCEGDSPKLRRKESVKWLWLEKPSSKASTVSGTSSSASRRKASRSRSR